MKHTLILALLMIAYLPGHGQCMLDKSQWQLVYSEDFNEPNVDALLANGWVIGDPHDPGPATLSGNTCGSGSSFMCFSKNQITLNNGLGYFNIQKMAPFNCQGNTAIYETGFMSSTFDEFPQYQNPGNTRPGYAFGMFEIRCKLPQAITTYPAFWLTGNTWPPEIDAFEYYGGTNSFISTVHWPYPNRSDTSQSCSNKYQYSHDLSYDFHTFTIVWTPQKITWFLDLKELKTDDISSHQPLQALINGGLYSEFFKWAKMHIIVNNFLLCPNDNANIAYDPLIVDYVKVYKPNGYVPIGNTNPQQYYNDQVSLYNNTPYKSTTDWVIHKVESPQSYAVNGTLRGAQGGGLYFYTGSDGYLWNTYWNGTGFTSARTVPNQYINTGDIALAQPEGIVFFRKVLSPTLTGIYYIQNGVTYYVPGTEDIPGLQSPFICSTDGLNLYYVNTSGKVVRVRRSTTSATWAKTEFNATADPNTKILLSPSNNAQVYYRSSYNNIVSLNCASNESFNVTSSGDVISNLLIKPDGKTIYYKNNLNQIKECIRSSAPIYPPIWSNNALMVYYPGAGTSTPLTNVKDGLCINTDLNSKQLYFQGTDNRSWYIYWDGVKYNASSFDWNHLDINDINGQFQTIKLGVTNNETHIIYRDNNNQIRLIRWEPCQVSNPSCGSTVLVNKKIPGNIFERVKALPASSILLYPNPFSDYLNITEAKDEAFDEIRITDILGRIYYQSKTGMAFSKTTIDTKIFPSGLYLVLLLNKGETVSQIKAVKL